MLITRLDLSEMCIPCKCVNHATTRGHDADCGEKHADKGEAFRHVSTWVQSILLILDDLH